MPVIGNTDVVVRLMRASGSAKVWDHVPSNADVHSYRSDYATALYDSLARPIEEIPFDRVNKGTGRKYQSEVYTCRGDRKGENLTRLQCCRHLKPWDIIVYRSLLGIISDIRRCGL